jgi:hypothetical protein
VRLCVDQSGRRVLDPEIDVLQIIAHESYDDYVASLAGELDELDAVERPAPPRRADEARTTPPTSDRVARFRLPPDLVARATRLAQERLDEPTPSGTVQGLIPLVDRVVQALARQAPGLPVRRATILAIVEQLHPPHVLADPHRVADAVVGALLEVVGT